MSFLLLFIFLNLSLSSEFEITRTNYESSDCENLPLSTEVFPELFNSDCSDGFYCEDDIISNSIVYRTSCDNDEGEECECTDETEIILEECVYDESLDTYSYYEGCNDHSNSNVIFGFLKFGTGVIVIGGACSAYFILPFIICCIVICVCLVRGGLGWIYKEESEGEGEKEDERWKLKSRKVYENVPYEPIEIELQPMARPNRGNNDGYVNMTNNDVPVQQMRMGNVNKIFMVDDQKV